MHAVRGAKLAPRRLVVILTAAILLACADSPTAPQPTNAAGRWSGTIGALPDVGLILFSFTQTGDSLVGTYAIYYATSPVYDSGSLHGSMHGSTLTVVQSSVLRNEFPYSFTATLSDSASMSGTYSEPGLDAVLHESIKAVRLEGGISSDVAVPPVASRPSQRPTTR